MMLASPDELRFTCACMHFASTLKHSTHTHDRITQNTKWIHKHALKRRTCMTCKEPHAVCYLHTKHQTNKKTWMLSTTPKYTETCEKPKITHIHKNQPSHLTNMNLLHYAKVHWNIRRFRHSKIHSQHATYISKISKRKQKYTPSQTTTATYHNYHSAKHTPGTITIGRHQITRLNYEPQKTSRRNYEQSQKPIETFD